jgi:uncharacterized Zn finger protein (UPF0148 family)
VAGSWDGLLSILKEARQEGEAGSRRRPVSCPDDGTLLVAGKGGALRCPFCGNEP